MYVIIKLLLNYLFTPKPNQSAVFEKFNILKSLNHGLEEANMSLRFFSTINKSAWLLLYLFFFFFFKS